MQNLKSNTEQHLNELKLIVSEQKQLRASTNPTVKGWVESLQAKEQILLEGLHVLQMYAERYGMPPIILLPADQGISDEIMEWLQVKGVLSHVWLIHSALLKKLSSLGSLPPLLGIAPSPRQIEVPSGLEGHASLWLDAIQDPGNAGTLIRTALGAGIRHIVFGKGSVDVWSPKVMRSAQGAHFHVQLWQDVDLVALAQSLPTLPKWGAAPGGESYETMGWKKPMALVLGNEGQGLSSELVSTLDGIVGIYLDTALESLNVAVAGAILIFEWRRCCS